MRQIDGIVLERAPQPGIDGEACGQRERRRLGQSRLRKVMEKAGVVLIDRGHRILDVPERRVENELHNAPLLV